MPKRYGQLWQPICDIENIKEATSTILNRRKQKGHWGKQEIAIAENFNSFCDKTQRSLINRTYDFGAIRHFSIKERRKERVIDHLDVAPSVLLQAVMNVCQPLFIEKYIDTTYSSIKGRGLIQMSKDIELVIKSHPDYHFLLIDAKKCYENVNHGVMMGVIKCVFKDKYVIDFFERLIGMLPNGLAIGFCTNHYLVNLLFSRLDHRIKKLHAVYIFRYMDDILILAPQSLLPKVYAIIAEEMNAIDQIIKPNLRFAPIDYGIRYCGFVYYTDRKLLSRDIVLSMKRKDRMLRKSNVPDEEYKQQMAAYWGWCKHSNSIALWKSIVKDKFYLFEKLMKRFNEIAEGRDRREQYEGEYWKKDDILHQELEFIKFRKTKVRGKDKYIIQARKGEEYGYFFTEAIGITDKLERYSDQLPFVGTITELPNKQGIKFMTII